MTAGRKRYPSFGTVWMQVPVGPRSPRTFRSREILLARLISSTKVSGHKAFIRSSFSIRWPGLRTSSSKVSKAFGGSWQRLIAAAKDPFAGHEPERAERISLRLGRLGRLRARGDGHPVRQLGAIR